jgi:hypothetical protein
VPGLWQAGKTRSQRAQGQTVGGCRNGDSRPLPLGCSGPGCPSLRSAARLGSWSSPAEPCRPDAADPRTSCRCLDEATAERDNGLRDGTAKEKRRSKDLEQNPKS